MRSGEIQEPQGGEVRVSVPQVSLFHMRDLVIGVAHLPILTRGEVVEKLRDTMRLSSCVDPLICLPSLYGGIILFKQSKPALRVEYDGFFALRGEECKASLEEFISALSKGKEACIQVNEGTLVITPRTLEGGVRIDVIGVRFIVD